MGLNGRTVGCLLGIALGLGSQTSLAQSVTGSWVGTWGTAPVGLAMSGSGADTGNITYRNIVHVSRGGTSVRVQLSNEFGTAPLSIGAVHVAISTGNGSINPSTDHAVTFGGVQTAAIPAGALIFSDPVSLTVAPTSDLAVSIFVSAQTISTGTRHQVTNATNYLTRNNTVTATTSPSTAKITSWFYLKAVDVGSAGSGGTVVTLGDSIADGYQSTLDANDRWPDVLAARLQANGGTSGVGVVNQGLAGNRVLQDVTGPNALARLDADVLALSSVKYLIVHEGINDLGESSQPATTAQALIAGLGQVVARAHNHGVKVYGATLTPIQGNAYYSTTTEQARQTVNTWIRSSGVFDAVLDFDAVLRNPSNTAALLSVYDSGDHLHPNDAGYKALGDSVELSLFE